MWLLVGLSRAWRWTLGGGVLTSLSPCRPHPHPNPHLTSASPQSHIRIAPIASVPALPPAMAHPPVVEQMITVFVADVLWWSKLQQPNKPNKIFSQALFLLASIKTETPNPQS
jgi:hypothetical protein